MQDFNALAGDDQQTSNFILFANKPPMAMNQKLGVCSRRLYNAF